MNAIGETIIVVNIIDEIGLDIDGDLKLLGLHQFFAHQIGLALDYTGFWQVALHHIVRHGSTFMDHQLIKPIQLGARGIITNNIQRARQWVNQDQGLRHGKLQFRHGKSARRCC